MSQDSFSLNDFRGTTRLFPLPNLVVFPHVVQPLHIFESRYIEMLEDAVADDQLLAMGLLMPGWEGQYEGRPPVDPFVCLGRIMSHAPAKEDRYNVLFAGIARAKIVEELPVRRSYREVELQVLDEVPPSEHSPETPKLYAELAQAFRKHIPAEILAEQHLSDILDKESDLGVLTDLVSYSLPLELKFRQYLLAETDVLQRTHMLLDHLKGSGEPSANQPFPPGFSEN